MIEKTQVTTDSKRLLQTAINEYLSDGAAPEFMLFESIGSTNTFAKEYARANPISENGIIIAADGQTAGRGRLGRSFLSDTGRGLYLTYLFKPTLSADKIIHLTTCAAVAVCSVLDELTGAKTEIKWVNDVYLGGKKLAGILTEGEFDQAKGAFSFAAVGIGINLYDVAFPEDLDSIATNLQSECGIAVDKNLLLAKLAKRLMQTLKSAENYIDEYRSRCFVIGERVRVLASDGQYEAVAEAVNDDGELIVKLDTGERKSLFSGEISIRKA